jgi:hypothetical protein
MMVKEQLGSQLVSILRRVFGDNPTFEDVWNHCRRMDLNYQEIKTQILRETNIKIEKHVEEE